MIDDPLSGLKPEGCVNLFSFFFFFHALSSCLRRFHKFMNDTAPLSSAATHGAAHIACCKSRLWLRSGTHWWSAAPSASTGCEAQTL